MGGQFWLNNPAIQANTKENLQVFTGWTGHLSAWKLAKQWIRNCSRDHLACDKYRASRLPDRVLDVSGYQVKLYESANEHVPYTCLSHCWGKAKAEWATTKDNLVPQKNGIQWESLPQTFRDAILFTRDMNVRYIWVDSIVSTISAVRNVDLELDGTTSVFCKMTLMIGSARLDRWPQSTLGAMSPSRQLLRPLITGGCFRNATNDAVGHSIEICNDTETAFTLRVRAQIQTHWMTLPCQMMCESFFGNLGDDPPLLFTRAWCFQELLLSPRIIRFDEWEISWCCRSTELCSCGYLDKVAVPARNLDKDLLQFLSNTDGQDALDSANIWRAIIHSYGPLLLTYKRDKLPAIAAVAETFKTRIHKDDEYLAGLWRSSIVTDMLWMNAGEENKSTIDRQEWLAPTWSWASCGGKPDYYFGHKQPLAKVIGLHCKPVEKAPFAQFQPGTYILLSGIAVTGIMVEKKAEVVFNLRDDAVDKNDWKRASNWATMDIPLSEAADKEVTILRLAIDDVYGTGEF